MRKLLVVAALIVATTLFADQPQRNGVITYAQIAAGLRAYNPTLNLNRIKPGQAIFFNETQYIIARHGDTASELFYRCWQASETIKRIGTEINVGVVEVTRDYPTDTLGVLVLSSTESESVLKQWLLLKQDDRYRLEMDSSKYLPASLPIVYDPPRQSSTTKAEIRGLYVAIVLLLIFATFYWVVYELGKSERKCS